MAAAALNQQIESILNPLLRRSGPPRDICLIDPPGHPNVGDSAILLGELAYLKRNFPGARLGFYDVESYSPGADRHIARADVLLLHGGGNFGDIWPRHHNFRLRILERFADRTIIQLPQSIHFSDPQAMAATARLIAAQKDFTLLVRDRKSLAVAQRHFDCPVVLSPDMAFAMDPIHRRRARMDCFCLLRQDKEAVADHGRIAQTVRSACGSLGIADWLDDPSTLVTRADRALVRLARRKPDLMAPLQPIMMAVRRQRAAQRVAAGIDILSGGSVVVTDRLHAHIMCCLMAIPHVVFDSLDGKISAFHQTWSSRFAGALLCSSVDQLTERLASRPSTGAGQIASG